MNWFPLWCGHFQRQPGDGGESGKDRLGVASISDAAGIGIVRGGGRGSSRVFTVSSGGMWRFIDIASSWGEAGGRTRIQRK